MKKYIAIFILNLLILPIWGQEIYGYYNDSPDKLCWHWKRVVANDIFVHKQQKRFLTKYVISYNDIKVKFKIDNSILWKLDSIGVNLDKLPHSHHVRFVWFHTNNGPRWCIGEWVLPVKHKNKSREVEIFPKPEWAINSSIEAHHNTLKKAKNRKRVYVYVERKGKYIKVSRKKALQMAEEENHPQQL